MENQNELKEQFKDESVPRRTAKYNVGSQVGHLTIMSRKFRPFREGMTWKYKCMNTLTNHEEFMVESVLDSIVEEEVNATNVGE